MEEYVMKKYKTRGEQLMKYAFLFGAGAEVGYGLPSGSKFALDIFRYDNSDSKDEFKKSETRLILLHPMLLIGCQRIIRTKI